MYYPRKWNFSLLTVYRFSLSDNLTKGRSFGTCAERNEKSWGGGIVISHHVVGPVCTSIHRCLHRVLPRSTRKNIFSLFTREFELCYIPPLLCYEVAFICST